MVEGKLQSMPRRPFEKYQFTGSYTAFERNMKGFKAAKTHLPGKTACLGGDPLTSYLNNGLVRELLHIPAKIQPWGDCSTIDYTILEAGS